MYNLLISAADAAWDGTSCYFDSDRLPFFVCPEVVQVDITHVCSRSVIESSLKF